MSVSRALTAASVRPSFTAISRWVRLVSRIKCSKCCSSSRDHGPVTDALRICTAIAVVTVSGLERFVCPVFSGGPHSFALLSVQIRTAPTGAGSRANLLTDATADLLAHWSRSFESKFDSSFQLRRRDPRSSAGAIVFETISAGAATFDVLREVMPGFMRRRHSAYEYILAQREFGPTLRPWSSVSMIRDARRHTS